MLYSKPMAWTRTGRTVRLMTMFLLVWTSIDLFYPGLCAIDRQTPSDALVSFHSGSSALSAADSTQQSPNSGGEDCFCCCQHIVSTTAWVPIPQSENTARLGLRPVDHIRVFHARLEHPPRLA